ncbi:MAG: SulP family inorganic anion transporter, partial [Deltaproteobacteria bacterium]|nr:SulP family inorganic anion transporter [Deltaproteobacteria bacterium]
MLSRVFPFLGWFKDYNTAAFRVDAIAGITVALVLIPQSMAYAQLAGLPAYYGLYAAFLPPLIAALFGSSHQLATGPVAIVSLMTAASLEPLATAGSASFIAYAILLALAVGLFQFCLGVLRLGLVINFLSHPVVNGFINAAALIIASSQLSKMFGVYVDKGEHHYETIIHVIEAAFHYTHWPTLLMGVGAFVVMYGLKRVNPRIPYVLVAVAAATIISWSTGFEHNWKASLSDIQAPMVQENIRQFNTTVETIKRLGEKRAQINLLIKEIKAEYGEESVEALKARQEEELTTVRLEAEKEKTHQLREDLRFQLFRAIDEPDGRLVFFLPDSAPTEAKDTGRAWRIKVGNTLIDENSIQMVGGGAVVGVVPPGLPRIGLPELNMGIMLHLFGYAVIIALLGFMEAISIAKAIAAKTGQRLDPNQELIGQGLANIIGCLGQSYPVSGSFSHSAVNLQAGAQTGMSSVFTSVMVVILL